VALARISSPAGRRGAVLLAGRVDAVVENRAEVVARPRDWKRLAIVLSCEGGMLVRLEVVLP